MAEITLAASSSVTLTVTAGQSITLNNRATDTARLEVVTGADAGKTITTRHAGRATYGPFNAGTVKLSAISGSVGYDTLGASAQFEPPTSQLTPTQAAAVSSILTPTLSAIPYVASGLTLPTSGASSAAAVASGDAWINGLRFLMAATPLSLTASRDNYIDLTYDPVSLQGYYVVQPVTIGAAAPALTVNGLRLGYITTGASTITGATQTGKDSLGNWMSNVVAKPVCSLYVGSGQSYFASSPANVIFGVGTEVYDNDFMHSVSSNNTRITLNKPGLYSIRGGFTSPSGVSGVVGTAIFKNGSQVTNQLQGLATYGVNGTWICSMTSLCAAGDYLELNVNPVANGFNLLSGFIEVVRQ